MPSPTPSQRFALEEVNDGKVERFYPPLHAPRWRGTGGSLKPGQETLDLVQRAGWISVGYSGAHETAAVDLTDTGRKALANG